MTFRAGDRVSHKAFIGEPPKTGTITDAHSSAISEVCKGLFENRNPLPCEDLFAVLFDDGTDGMYFDFQLKKSKC